MPALTRPITALTVSIIANVPLRPIRVKRHLPRGKEWSTIGCEPIVREVVGDDGQGDDRADTARALHRGKTIKEIARDLKVARNTRATHPLLIAQHHREIVFAE